MSNGFGILCRIYFILTFITYSVDVSPPPTFRGRSVRTVEHMKSVSMIADEIYAF
jgi:hypothetical protein